MYAAGDTEGGDKEIKRLARINRRQHVLTDNKLTVTVPVSVSKNMQKLKIFTTYFREHVHQCRPKQTARTDCYISRFVSYVPTEINFAI